MKNDKCHIVICEIYFQRNVFKLHEIKMYKFVTMFY
jgi:hypothetical protein